MSPNETKLIMKEYKSITIYCDFKKRLDSQLNMLSEDGWQIKEILSKDIGSNEIGSVFILFERDAKFTSNFGYDKWYNQYKDK